MQVLSTLKHPAPVSYTQAVEQFHLWAASRNLAPKTLVWYKDRLRCFERFLQETGRGDAIQGITEKVIQEFLKALSEKKRRTHSDYTVRKTYDALRTFFKFLHSENVIFINPMANTPAPRTSMKLLRPLTQDEVSALLAAVNKKTFCSFRDYVLLMLFLDTGLRLNEALGLRLCDVNLQEGTLLVMGKGRKERKVPYGQTLKGLLVRYLQMRGTLAGQELVFVNQYGQRLTGRRIQDYLKRYARQAGIQKVVHPHLLRHTFALNFILQGGNPFILQEILGHTTLEMTRRYVSLANQSFTTNRVSFMDKLAESGQASLPRRKMF